jgi:hypothetical protein
MKTPLLIFSGVCFSIMVIAQPTAKKSVVIGKMTTKENALLILNPPDADQGIILPQLSTVQRMSLKPNSPSEDGLIVFDTNLKSYHYWSDGAWVQSLADNKRNTSFYSIDPMHFQQLSPNNDGKHNSLAVFETDNTFVTITSQAAGESIIAPINLSHQASMKNLTLYYMDNDDDNFTVKLIRKRLSGTNDEIISWESSGRSPVIQQISFTAFNNKETIDLENYTYRLLVVFDIDHNETIRQPSEARQRIYGVKIQYEE